MKTQWIPGVRVTEQRKPRVDSRDECSVHHPTDDVVHVNFVVRENNVRRISTSVREN